MTVQELIDALIEYPPDAPVIITEGGIGICKLDENTNGFIDIDDDEESHKD